MIRLTEAGWTPRVKLWDWRSYLTTDERIAVETAERQQHAARDSLAKATATLNPIRNRAIHRAKDAAGRSALTSGEDADAGH